MTRTHSIIGALAFPILMTAIDMISHYNQINPRWISGE
jgi:hypothetical protein